VTLGLPCPRPGLVRLRRERHRAQTAVGAVAEPVPRLFLVSTEPSYTWRQPRPVILAACPKEFAACFALDDVANKHKPPKATDDVTDLFLKTFVRSMKTFRGTLLLAGHGFGPQAGMLARSLFEDMLIVHYVEKKPQVVARLEPARKLLLDKYREAMEGFGRGEEIPDDFPARLTPGQRKAAQAQNPSNRWAGVTVDRLVDAVEDMWGDEPSRRLLRQFHVLSNLTNNALVHHSPLALHVSVQKDGYTVGAGFEYVKEALGSAFYSYANLLSVVLEDQGRAACEKVYAEQILLWGRLVTEGGGGSPLDEER
jgi:hypothetical protein